MDMRHINLTFGTVIFLCVTYVSFNHSIQLFHIGGYLGNMAIAGVVAGETLYAMGIINTVYSLMSKTPAPTSARVATVIGTLMVGWANIYDGWELWKAENNPVGIIIGIAIMTYLWVADGIIVETLSNFFKKTSTKPETSSNQEGATNTNQPIEVKPTTGNNTNTNSNNIDDSITDDNTDTGNANNTDNDVVGSDNNTMNTNNNDDDNDAVNDDNNKADRNNDNQQRQQQENQQQGNSVVEGDNDTLNDDTNTVNRNDDNLQQHDNDDNHNNTLNANTNNQQHDDTDNNDSNNHDNINQQQHDNNDNMKKHNTNNKAKTNDNNKAETNNDNNKRAKVVDMSERRKKRKELDPDTVIAIYLAEGSNAQIGKQFGVSAEAVRKIKLGQRHAEVTAPYRQAK